ncbi:MAG: nucleoside kinase, partial [Anaerovoracaceae bacterium]
ALRFHCLGGEKFFFYGISVPSTGYLKTFELRKYRDGVLLRFPQAANPLELAPYVDDKKMYAAFAEEARWQKLLDIGYVSDLNEKIAKGEIREVVQLSEALHDKKIVEIAQAIQREEKRIILIAGPSSSGKTTFARRLAIQLKVNGLKPIYLGTDDYFINREDMPLDKNGEKDFEGFDA